jgi:antitoxin component of MazEF toxin-antitoxin module
MSRKRIAASQDSAATGSPHEVLEGMGMREGDQVDVSVSDRTLIMRSLDAERARKIEDAMKAVFERRSAAYNKLA